MPAGPLSGGWGLSEREKAAEEKKKREKEEEHRNSRRYLARYDGLSTLPPLVNHANKPAETMKNAAGASTANPLASDIPVSGATPEIEQSSNKLRVDK